MKGRTIPESRYRVLLTLTEVLIAWGAFLQLGLGNV